jgi:putative DNA primase/helicase
MQSTIEAAREYKRRGWNPIPLRPGEKRPTDNGWQRLTIADEHIEAVFTNHNVGISLGRPSNNLFDVDLDDALVIKMQRHFLPKTPAIFGRPSKPASHMLYQGEPTDEVARKQFADGTEMLAELRGNGHQTMMPPSIHPAGEQLEWHDPTAQPATVPAKILIDRLGWLCSAAMLVRGWSDWNDAHHVLVGAIAGLFATREIRVEQAENFVRAIVLYADDHEPDDRIRMVRDTYIKVENGESVTGWPTIKEIIGEARATKLGAWLNLPKTTIDESDQITLTDDGNARLLVKHHGDDLKYVHEWGKWLQWDGSRWSTDERENIIAIARGIPEHIRQSAANILDDDARKKVESWANASRNVNRIKAMPVLARADERVKIAADMLDADPWSFNVPNGTINLRTGGISGGHDKTDLITKLSPVNYQPQAQSPLWDSYLTTIFDGDLEMIDFVQRCVGYSLTGLTTEQVFFILHGPQGTGKTTFIETLRAIFGEYSKNADPSTFMQKQKSGRATPEIARLQGARFVSSSETEENERLATGVVKRLSGNTRMTASNLYAPDFEFDPVMKLWIDTNHKPRISATDDAVWARLILIPFEVELRHTVREIKGFPALLRTELPGILRWAVEGCLKWQIDGLARPDKVKNASQEYRDDSDALQLFIDEACLTAPDLTCTASTMYAAYSNWAREAGERPVNMRTFKVQLTERGFESKRSATGQSWSGIRPIEDAAQPQPFGANPFTSRPHA